MRQLGAQLMMQRCFGPRDGWMTFIDFSPPVSPPPRSHFKRTLETGIVWSSDASRKGSWGKSKYYSLPFPWNAKYPPPLVCNSKPQQAYIRWLLMSCQRKEEKNWGMSNLRAEGVICPWSSFCCSTSQLHSHFPAQRQDHISAYTTSHMSKEL